MPDVVELPNIMDLVPVPVSMPEKIDKLEAELLANFPVVDCPLTHRFTPGLYTREIFMPAGTLITSKIHKTEHPFVILSGVVKVWTEDEGVVELSAGHVGITKPGTRRILYIVSDCRWATFHPLTEAENAAQDVDLIEARIIEPRNIEITGKYKALLNEAVLMLENGACE